VPGNVVSPSPRGAVGHFSSWFAPHEQSVSPPAFDSGSWPTICLFDQMSAGATRQIAKVQRAKCWPGTREWPGEFVHFVLGRGKSQEKIRENASQLQMLKQLRKLSKLIFNKRPLASKRGIEYWLAKSCAENRFEWGGSRATWTWTFSPKSELLNSGFGDRDPGSAGRKEGSRAFAYWLAPASPTSTAKGVDWGAE